MCRVSYVGIDRLKAIFKKHIGPPVYDQLKANTFYKPHVDLAYGADIGLQKSRFTFAIHVLQLFLDKFDVVIFKCIFFMNDELVIKHILYE